MEGLGEALCRDAWPAQVRKLRERIPGLVLRTTFITGFPGETPADHAELVK
jgi:ribosomal protein S12 methylthiotransferase